MAEYLAPGVYVEETSYRAKTIEGVSTSTAAFVGPMRYGPHYGDPELVTSFGEFERIFGGLDQLTYAAAAGETTLHNYTAHAVRSFFEEGGRRLYIARTFRSRIADNEHYNETTPGAPRGDGHAQLVLEGRAASPAAVDILLRARYPGAAGNMQVTFTANVGQNTLADEPEDPTNPTGPTRRVLRGVESHDLVWIGQPSATSVNQTNAATNPQTGGGDVYRVNRALENGRVVWHFMADTIGGLDLTTDTLPAGAQVRAITLTVEVVHRGRTPRTQARTQTWEGLGFDPRHPRWVGKVFKRTPTSRSQALEVPMVLWIGGWPATPDSADPDPDDLPDTAVTIARTLLDQVRSAADVRVLRYLYKTPNAAQLPTVLDSLGYSDLPDAARRFTVTLAGGNDGARPTAADYEGREGEKPGSQSGLRAFESLAEISIVAAPGSTFGGREPEYEPQSAQIARLLIAHCERMKYRIAVLDSRDKDALSEVQQFRAKIDSKHAALYYPWIRVLDPVTEQEIDLPPSGSVAGIYARNDVEYGVHKAPANEIVRQAIGLEATINKAQQDILNPQGVNCFRYFDGRGFRLWGARTISSDPEWKYVNLRRYFAYLERSVERGTQWVVFSNNSEPLWANVQRTVEDFLFNEWKSARLMGERPAEAYFVRCDRSTMTQNDIDNGRLVCLIGVAPVRPAEFVIFRIGQWTADRRA
jgi:phage tail sheath protein FI